MNLSYKIDFLVAEKFWRYMKGNNQLLGTRTELRHFYKSSFLPTLTKDIEKDVPFAQVMWCFRNRKMRVIKRTPPNDRENIVYLKGKTAAVDQSHVPKREKKPKQETKNENSDSFDELKKKLVDQR